MGEEKNFQFFSSPISNHPVVIPWGGEKRRTSTGISTFARQEENKPILEEAM
jgi:hypothetical protein